MKVPCHTWSSVEPIHSFWFGTTVACSIQHTQFISYHSLLAVKILTIYEVFNRTEYLFPVSVHFLTNNFDWTHILEAGSPNEARSRVKSKEDQSDETESHVSNSNCIIRDRDVTR